MRHYYNENDKYAAQWIRNNMAAGLIPEGDVDERSIVDVRPSDLDGYRSCHFFAGFGGWPFALRIAGWPEGLPVWTGSCPCQPFSVAGKRGGFDDPRHLWPHWLKLIAKRRPSAILGEQSAAAAAWLNLVRGDLEALDYAVGAIPMEAASADADHFRDRYWFVADHDEQRASEGRQQRGREFSRPSCDTVDHAVSLADRHTGFSEHEDKAVCAGRNAADNRRAGLLADCDGMRSQIEIGKSRDIGAEQPALAGNDIRSLVNGPSVGWGEGWAEHEFRGRGFTAAVAGIDGRQYLECPDGKWRRLPPPGVRWLGTRIPARVDKLRAIGNAIDHRPAVAFVTAYMAARGIGRFHNQERAA